MPNINELQENLQVEAFYALRNLSLRDTRSGGNFIRLTLGDATGSISGNIWRITDNKKYIDLQDEFNDIATAKVVKIRGKVESYNGNLQIIIDRIREASKDETSEILSRLIAHSPYSRENLRTELQQLVDSFTDQDYKNLLMLFLDDEEFMEVFSRAPAAKTFHHAYIGGLLEHTVSIMRTCDKYAASQPNLRRDLLLSGAFFHDIGKTEELAISTSIEYTDAGSLLGHLTQGVLLVEHKFPQLPEFPQLKRRLVLHLILSHHGCFEFGSPVLPAIPEAFALHHIDNLDAKVQASNTIIANDANPAANWTERSYMLETRLFKG